jgi:hypothetical protein
LLWVKTKTKDKLINCNFQLFKLKIKGNHDYNSYFFATKNVVLILLASYGIYATFIERNLRAHQLNQKQGIDKPQTVKIFDHDEIAKQNFHHDRARSQIQRSKTALATQKYLNNNNNGGYTEPPQYTSSNTTNRNDNNNNNNNVTSALYSSPKKTTPYIAKPTFFDNNTNYNRTNDNQNYVNQQQVIPNVLIPKKQTDL